MNQKRLLLFTGRWPRSQAGFYTAEGAPGPSPLGTGEEELDCW